MRRFVLAAMMFGAASGAHAADMPDFPALRGGFTDGLNTARVNWQGFYVGGQASYGSITSDRNSSTYNTALQSDLHPAGRGFLSIGGAGSGAMPPAPATADLPDTTGNGKMSSSVSKANYLHTGLSAVTSWNRLYLRRYSVGGSTSTFSSARVNADRFRFSAASRRLRDGMLPALCLCWHRTWQPDHRTHHCGDVRARSAV